MITPTELHEQVLAIYDEHFRFLFQFEDIAEDVERLSHDFNDAHDDLLSCLVLNEEPSAEIQHRAYMIAEEIMALVNIKKAMQKSQEQRSVKPPISFNVSSSERERIAEWLDGVVYPELIAKQKREYPVPSLPMRESWDCGYPYIGAIGGGLTYEFSPTAIGVVFKVCYGKDHELDLTDYGSW